jgi:hypothetical protein
MSKRAKEIIYLILAAPSAVLLYIICGFMDWAVYGDMKPRPIDGWLFLALTFLLIMAVNILPRRRKESERDDIYKTLDCLTQRIDHVEAV